MNHTKAALGILLKHALRTRVLEHKERRGSAFCRKYNCDRLVYFEAHQNMGEAIARETAIKAWKREWKLQLIVEFNPAWRDLCEDLHLL